MTPVGAAQSPLHLPKFFPRASSLVVSWCHRQLGRNGTEVMGMAVRRGKELNPKSLLFTVLSRTDPALTPLRLTHPGPRLLQTASLLGCGQLAQMTASRCESECCP